jgi:hypothetical protein
MTHCRYTIVCEFRGGTYVSQVIAGDLFEAVRAWTDYLARDRPIPRSSTYLAKTVAAQTREVAPTALKGLSGVWCVTATCGGDLMLANIVETVQAIDGS